MSFESVVLKGLANDGGLFIPESIPTLPTDWQTKWASLPFADLAFEVMSLYVSESEIPSSDLRALAHRSYSTFRHADVTPVATLDAAQNLHLLELFHGPTFAFKDVALQFLGNLFEYFLTRRNQGKGGKDRHHLTVIGATSGDTGSAAIYGLRGKRDVSVFIMHPRGKVSPIQEKQMTTVLDANVHNLAVEGTFDDCQDAVKALFADAETNQVHHLAAVNSINWARILAQIPYYFKAYFDMTRREGWNAQSKVNFVVPTGNFGDILAGDYARRMGLFETNAGKLIVASNENDILPRFWETGRYEKEASSGDGTLGGYKADGAQAKPSQAKATVAPAMDIAVSSNFERELYLLQLEVLKAGGASLAGAQTKAASTVKTWLDELKSKGGFAVSPAVLETARRYFSAERVNDLECLATIDVIYKNMNKYILDPHSAIGVQAALRSITKSELPQTHHVVLATAHPAKFSEAVKKALSQSRPFDFDAEVLPPEFVGLLEREARVRGVKQGASVKELREILDEEIAAEVR